MANEPVTVNLNPSPKFRFRESNQNISDHRALVETRTFQRACDYALMEYQAQLAIQASENPQLAGAVGLKLAGANEFLMTLRLLSEMPRIVSKPVIQNLDHKV